MSGPNSVGAPGSGLSDIYSKNPLTLKYKGLFLFFDKIQKSHLQFSYFHYILQRYEETSVRKHFDFNQKGSPGKKNPIQIWINLLSNFSLEFLKTKSHVGKIFTISSHIANIWWNSSPSFPGPSNNPIEHTILLETNKFIHDLTFISLRFFRSTKVS